MATDPLAEIERRIKDSHASEVARELGISRQFLYQIRNKLRSPTPDVLKRLGIERRETFVNVR